MEYYNFRYNLKYMFIIFKSTSSSNIISFNNYIRPHNYTHVQNAHEKYSFKLASLIYIVQLYDTKYLIMHVLHMYQFDTK